jgi:hypothetical protein
VGLVPHSLGRLAELEAEGQDAEGPESLVVQYNIDWGLLSAAAVTTAIRS